MQRDNGNPERNGRGRKDNILDGIIMTAISVVLLLILFGAFGRAGNAVAKGLKGVFGYAIYGLCFATLAVGIIRFLNWSPRAKVTTIIGAILIFVTFIMIFQVPTGREYVTSYGGYLKGCYSGANTAGGAFFGLIVYPIAKINYIFAIVLFSLLLVGAVVLTFFVQINKLTMFKSFAPIKKDKALPMAGSDRVDRNTKEVVSDLATVKLDGSIPNDKIGKMRKQTGHDAIRSLEEKEIFAERLDGTSPQDSVVILEQDPNRWAKEKVTPKLPTALEEVPPSTQDEILQAVTALYEKEQRERMLREKQAKTKQDSDNLTKEDAARILYDPQEPKHKINKKDFNEVDRSYTINAKLEELERNLSNRNKGVGNDSQHVVTNHDDMSQSQDDNGRAGTSGNAENVEYSPSVSEQVSGITGGDDYFVKEERHDNEDRLFDEQGDGQAMAPKDEIAERYRRLQESEPEDLTARNTEPLESFEDVLGEQNYEKRRQARQEQDKGHLFKKKLEERKRKERSDKGGVHVGPLAQDDDDIISQMDTGTASTANARPTFGKGVNFDLNTNKTDKSQEETKTEEQTCKTLSDASINYRAPRIDLLNNYVATPSTNEDLTEKIENLERTLADFNIDAKVVNIITGPTFTRLELQLPRNISVNKVDTYAKDIAMCLEAQSIRLLTPIPGKNLFGIELPNKVRGTVGLKDLFNSPEFNVNNHEISFAVGQDCDGNKYVIDLVKTPHLMIAGATGAGKSVCINTLLCSIMYKYSPSDVKVALVDPKQVELSRYNGIPHLLVREAIDQKENVINLLDWAINEMEGRYSLLKTARVTCIKEYNKQALNAGKQKLPYIVIVIDEVADIVMTLKKDLEERLTRIAQKARAAGIIVVLATQRPSVDVITGIIKANLPSKMAFAVASQVDSRTILDQVGAEKLLRYGDMLYLEAGNPNFIRIQGAFIGDDEVNAICKDVIQNNESYFDPDIEAAIYKPKQSESSGDVRESGGMPDVANDKTFVLCLKRAIEKGSCSSSDFMRRFGIGFQKAARYVDTMEELGYIGKESGAKTFSIYLTMSEFMETYGDFDLS